MEAESPSKAPNSGIPGLITILGVPLTLVLFIWFFKGYIYDVPMVTTFLDAGMLFSPHERLLIWPIALLTLVGGLAMSRLTGGSLIRPATFIPGLVLIFLGLLFQPSFRRGAVDLY